MSIGLFRAVMSLGLVLVTSQASALEITSISPEPLVSGSMAQLSGGPFDGEDLVVLLNDEEQTIQVAQESELLFEVSDALPLGPAVLRVETGGESVEVDVEISAPPPTIGSVLPQPVVMGDSANIVGSDLAGVTAVLLNMVPCEITAQTDIQMAFVVPFDAELLGTATLRLETAAWYAETSIQVKAPTPSIDALSPNPVRQGDLLTVTGTIVPASLAVSLGDQDAEIFSAVQGEVVVQVPEDLAPGPVQVIVHLGEVASEAVGPLHVQSASSKRPTIERVAPANLVQGGNVWLFGDEMDHVEWASEGLTLAGCDEKACSVTPEGEKLGQLHGAIGGPEGTDIFTLQVLADILIVPELSSLDPNPAFRGQRLTLHGANLHQVNTVFVGGMEQTIEFVDLDVVEVTLHEDTPMGAERVMVAGGSGSNALSVTVLEPLNTPEEDTGADVAEEVADTSTAPDTSDDQDVATSDVPTSGGSKSSGGCAGGPHPHSVALLSMLLLVCLRRRTT
jgi:hypothetical protein